MINKVWYDTLIYDRGGKVNNKNRIALTIILTVLIGLLTIAGSFALWTIQLGNNITVALNTADLNNYVEYT